MGIRDREIERIVQYAKGLGIKVVWKKHKRGGPGAQWYTDGSCIEMFTYPGKSKTQIILDFVHELAHHMAWVYDGRKVALKTDQAFLRDTEHKRGDPPLPKGQRQLIFDAELKDSYYRPQIFKELGLSIPIWKMYADRSTDMWVYRRWCTTGVTPTKKNIREQYRSRREVYRSRWEP